jgi:hypothetical protein
MLQGSYKGKLNDWRMFKLTGIEQRIRQIFRDHDLLYLYNDSAYRVTYEVLRSWRGHSTLNKKQRNFNKCMSKVRILVEQGFELTQKQWSHNSWSITQKIDLQSVAAYYMIGILLTNCYTCIKDNQIKDQFLVSTSTLRSYLTRELIDLFLLYNFKNFS